MNDTTISKRAMTPKPSSSPSSKDTPRRLVNNVTAENYGEIGKAFIGVYGGAVIALEDARSKDIECPACPRQWGAWRAYFKARKIKTHFMDQQGREGKMWTVPADWPHNFDSDATVQGDMEAGTRFMRNYRPPRIDMADLAHRQATVAAWRAGIPKEPLRGRWEPEREQPGQFIDRERLLESYEADYSAMINRKRSEAA